MTKYAKHAILTELSRVSAVPTASQETFNRGLPAVGGILTLERIKEQARLCQHQEHEEVRNYHRVMTDTLEARIKESELRYAAPMETSLKPDPEVPAVNAEVENRTTLDYEQVIKTSRKAIQARSDARSAIEMEGETPPEYVNKVNQLGSASIEGGKT